jgi:hypothetical protein
MADAITTGDDGIWFADAKPLLGVRQRSSKERENPAERQRLSAEGAGKPGLKVDDVGPLRGHPYPG